MFHLIILIPRCYCLKLKLFSRFQIEAFRSICLLFVLEVFLLCSALMERKHPSNMLSMALFLMYWYFLWLHVRFFYLRPFNVFISFTFLCLASLPSLYEPETKRWCEGLDKVYSSVGLYCESLARAKRYLNTTRISDKDK